MPICRGSLGDFCSALELNNVSGLIEYKVISCVIKLWATGNGLSLGGASQSCVFDVRFLIC